MTIHQNSFNDEYFVKKAQEGDQEALECLLKRYHNLAFYIALKICHCEADAEDIVQESFIEIERSISKLQEPKYFKAWLNKVIFSKSTKLFRQNKDVSVSDRDVMMMNESREERRYLLPKEAMNFQSDREVLLHFLACLPDKLRITLYLMYFEQLSVKEIAFALDVPEGTVKSRISSGKAELKAMISQYEQQEQVKLDFHAVTLESALIYALGKEYERFERSKMKRKGKTKGWKETIQAIPRTALVLMCTGVITVSAAVGGIFIQEYLSEEQTENSSETITKQNYHTFDPVMFQGKRIMSAREAYEALTNAAHCYIEVEALDEDVRLEMNNVYQSLKKTGGVYYELICRRQYAKIFE